MRAPCSSACASLAYIVLLVVAVLPAAFMEPVAFMSMLPVAFMSLVPPFMSVAFMSVVPALRSVLAFVSAVLLALLLLPHAASATNAVAIATLVVIFMSFPLRIVGGCKALAGSMSS